jgi:hypothetical protein
MTDRATTLKAAIVGQTQWLARPVTYTAMRTTLGVVIVLAVAAALWYAKTAIFLAFAGILLVIVLHGASSALSRVTGLPHLLSLSIVVVTGVSNLSQQVLNAADKQKLLQDFDITKLLSQFSP